MHNRMKKYFGKAGVAAGAVLGSAASSFAAIDATTQSEIQSAITNADSTYYIIGGTVLTVVAGIWGFKQLKRLLG
nr:major capsid protein [uncultured Desulfuromonas sp.]